MNTSFSIYKRSLVITTCLILFIFPCKLNAQNKSGTISGTVKDENNKLVPFAAVVLKDTKHGTTTDEQGNFHLKNIPTGRYTILIQYLGYETIQQEINVNSNKIQNLDFRLMQNQVELNEVVVFEKSGAAILREESYAVEVLESKTFKSLAVNANEILNKVPGVNIRQSGGFGEDAVLSLNGLTGSQVRIFIDGIPMEYFGSSLSLNNFPANIIEQIEVYKGVVPIHLSADALGGGVNIATNKSQKSYLDASYSYGSFNTQKASLNAQYREKSTGFTARLKSFYNVSDNNYTVDIDTSGNEESPKIEVEHFHDAYESKMAWLETGFTNTKFADEFMFGVMYSDNYNEMQQPKTALGDSEDPYGEVFEKENKLISTFNYAKNHFLNKNLSFSSYLVYVNSEYIYKNISSYEYDWYGNKTLVIDGTGEGDARPTFLALDSKNVLGNVNTGYAFSDINNLAFNYNINSLSLEGNDPYNGQNNTRFSNPITFNKQVFASSYTHSFFGNNFRNTAFVKYYKYTQNSTDTDYFGDEEINTSANYDHLGYGLATSYFHEKIQFKASFEHSVRFPDVIELYGDGTNYRANPYLKPEESNNFNIGAIYKNLLVNYCNVLFSVNGFIRDSKNFIFGERGGDYIEYKNKDNVLTTGVDFSANYKYQNKFNFNIAGTYTHQVNNDKYNAGDKNSLYKERMPNEPFLYGNVTVSYLKDNLFISDDNFSVNVYENYIHDFYYRWRNLGFSDDKYVIPSQLTTDIDFVYGIQNQKYNFSFGIINVFDVDTYDNLYQQNPGRSYNFKLRYFIN